MNQNEKTITFVLVLLLAFSLAACKPKQETTPDAGDTTQQETTPEENVDDPDSEEDS